MHNPIIITGAARSRTSFTMQILQLSGMFLGRVIGATKANKWGQLENTDIIDKVQKPLLRKYGYDHLGQNPLPPPNFKCTYPNLKNKVMEIMKAQGLKDQIWGFKDAKACLTWRAWDEAFPDATWIIVRRNDKDIIKSCLRTSFMRAYDTEAGWQHWVNEHKIRFDEIKQNCRWYELNTDQVIKKDLTQLEPIIKGLDLDWKPDKIIKQIHI